MIHTITRRNAEARAIVEQALMDLGVPTTLAASVAGRLIGRIAKQLGPPLRLAADRYKSTNETIRIAAGLSRSLRKKP